MADVVLFVTKVGSAVTYQPVLPVWATVVVVKPDSLFARQRHASIQPTTIDTVVTVYGVGQRNTVIMENVLAITHQKDAEAQSAALT